MNTNFLKVIFLPCLIVFTGACSNNGNTKSTVESNDSINAEYIETRRALQTLVVHAIDSQYNNRRLYIQFYCPFGHPCDRSRNPQPIRTCEFSDTAICTYPGYSYYDEEVYERISTPRKIVENTPDSFVLISYNPSYDYGLSNSCATRDHEQIVEFVREAKQKLPHPRLKPSSGIPDNMRLKSWIAVFKKTYEQEGVRLDCGDFSYLVKFPDLKKQQRSEKELRELAQKRLPPFLMYSFDDYIDYFGPHFLKSERGYSSFQIVKEIEDHGLYADLRIRPWEFCYRYVEYFN